MHISYLSNNMIIKNLYSACIQITTKNLTILCDPWFSQGIADGSWYLFPKPKNALRCIDDPDLIYISHIHNDNYDSKFLKIEEFINEKIA